MIDERMFDFKEFYKRVANELQDGCRIVEVGVADGASAIFLAKELESMGKQYHLYMVDNMDYGKYDQLITLYTNIFASQVNFQFITIIPKDSIEASQLFNDNYFDFVFLDSSHTYPYTKEEIPAWYPKLKDGCILAGHDYFSEENPGVQQAVLEILPATIQRPPIIEQEQYFDPHQFLFTEQTERECGIWCVTKVFYWQPKEDTFDWRKCYARFINLNHRTDRLEHMNRELARVGLQVERLPALKTSEHQWDAHKVQTMIVRGTGGNVGCHYSQVSVMQAALDNGQDAMVLEDDLIFCTDIKERLDYIQKFLNSHEWDVFFLGGTVHVNPAWWHKKGHSPDLQMCDCTLERDAEQTDDKRILRTYGAFSTHAYIVNKNSIAKILKYFDENVHLSMGVDWLFIKMQPQLKAYCFVPGCVIQRDNMSDIGGAMTIFSGFKMLGAHWFQDKMDEFNPDTYEWGEASKK